MFEIRNMTAADRDAVLPLVSAMYHSAAVEHDVDPSVLEQTFNDAVDPGEPLLRGLVLAEDGKAVGYAYITECYSGEIGSRCVFFEEMYFAPECRGKGYGTQVFHWIKENYPNHKRIRLEVTKANEGAIHLYKRLGFQFLEYRQMILEGDLQA